MRDPATLVLFALDPPKTAMQGLDPPTDHIKHVVIERLDRYRQKLFNVKMSTTKSQLMTQHWPSELNLARPTQTSTHPL